MEDRTMGRYSTMVAKQRKQLRRMLKYLGVYLRDKVRGWAQLVNRGQNGDAIEEGAWGCRRCGGMYGVSARRNLSGVVGWTYSVGDADARRCPLTDTSDSNSDLESNDTATEIFSKDEEAVEEDQEKLDQVPLSLSSIFMNLLVCYMILGPIWRIKKELTWSSCKTFSGERITTFFFSLSKSGSMKGFVLPEPVPAMITLSRLSKMALVTSNCQS